MNKVVWRKEWTVEWANECIATYKKNYDLTQQENFDQNPVLNEKRSVDWYGLQEQEEDIDKIAFETKNQSNTNILDCNVQFYKSHRDTIGYEVNLLNYLTSDYVKKVQEDYDNQKSQDGKHRVKDLSGCITPSGTFKKRSAEMLKTANGLMQFDIDFKDNKGFNAIECREKLGSQGWCAFSSLSISKRGVWGLAKISGDVKLAAKSLIQRINKLGYVMDTAPTSIVSLRYACYDRDAIFNFCPITLPPAIKPLRKKRETGCFDSSTSEDIDALASYCLSHNVSLLESYDDWMLAGNALASLGESGRSAFHDLSSLSAKYEREKTDQHFNNWLKSRNGRVTIASLFHIAKNAGVDLRGIKKK